MPARDIDRIIERLAVVRPDIRVEQLQVTHPADDDGIWFFRRGSSGQVVQLESSFGTFPFIVEASYEPAQTAGTVEEAIALIARLLDQPLSDRPQG